MNLLGIYYEIIYVIRELKIYMVLGMQPALLLVLA
jgi:hypothetical protein